MLGALEKHLAAEAASMDKEETSLHASALCGVGT